MIHRLSVYLLSFSLAAPVFAVGPKVIDSLMQAFAYDNAQPKGAAKLMGRREIERLKKLATMEYYGGNPEYVDRMLKILEKSNVELKPSDSFLDFKLFAALRDRSACLRTTASLAAP